MSNNGKDNASILSQVQPHRNKLRFEFQLANYYIVRIEKKDRTTTYRCIDSWDMASASFLVVMLLKSLYEK